VTLGILFRELAGVFDSALPIEKQARAALIEAAPAAMSVQVQGSPLPRQIIEVMQAASAHPACEAVLQTPLPWAPPQTSADPKYVAHSAPKSHVELLGPDGLVKSDKVRLGLYGYIPGAEYGIRTHPAEEVFIMMAGQAWWKRGDEPYKLHGPGERAHHPSMLPHATRTTDNSFMSAYVWCGDLSTQNYVYEGLPAG
jgi:quercetin dioxygenase-like cupin family protein